MSKPIMNIQLNSYKSKQLKSKSLKSKVKSALAIGAISILSLSSLSTFATDYSRAKKELRIMNKIFEASLSDSKLSRNRFSGTSKATYLAKQGMVFTFNFGRNHFGSGEDWQAFGEGIGQLVGSISAEIIESISEIDVDMPPVPNAPRVPPVGSDWDENIEAYEVYQEALENMRDEQRDKRREVRELQRSIREIERHARSKEVNTKKLAVAKKKLEQKVKVLAKKMEIYEKSRKEYKEKKRAKHKLNNQKKSDLIVTTLCDYGATLRSLKNGEYVTLIFDNYDNGKDQVYVFNYNHVRSCSDKDKLLKRAISYQL